MQHVKFRWFTLFFTRMFFRPRLITLFFCRFKVDNIKKIYKNENVQMCREISVAGTFKSCFHTKPRLEYLLFEKEKNTLRLCLVNQTFLYCLRSEIVLLRPEFYLLPPWPAPTLVAAILFLPDSAEFFKRCASAQTCTVHEIYPLTDDFNVSDATCAYSASCIKKGTP